MNVGCGGRLALVVLQNMKTLTITILLAFIGHLFAAEPIPVREPAIGEARPGWWWSLWLRHVVVIEGTVEWNEGREPEIQVSADHDALETAIGQRDTKLFLSRTKFRLGRIKPKRLLFAAPGITSSDGRFALLANGQINELQVLLPVTEVGKIHRVELKNKSSGVFIFQYGSMLVTNPMVYDTSIPKDGMASAEALFKHRNSFDYLHPKKQLGEQAGTGQPVPAQKAK